MNAIIGLLRRAGYEVRLDRDQVICLWKGAGRPDPATVRPLLNDLKHRKTEVLDALRAEVEAFDERAGIAEYDGGLLRAEAEALALECILHHRVG